MVEEGEATVPDVTQDFRVLLQAYGLKEPKAQTIAKYIADTGQPDIFDDPEALAEKLAKWPRDITPVTRATVLEHWGAQRGIHIPKELLKRIEAPDSEREKTAEGLARVQGGRLWSVDEDARGRPKLRLARKDETPLTLTEATGAMRQMGVDDEAPVVYNEQTGRHEPNWKSDFSKRFPQAAWLAAREQDRASAIGEEVDPFQQMMDQIAKTEMLKTAVGGGSAAVAPQSTVGEIIQGMRELREMEGGRASGPEWTSDPVQFMQVIDAAVERRMPKADAAAAEQVKDLRDEVKNLTEALRKAEMAKWEQQVTTLTNTVKELQEDMNKPRAAAGAGAADIILRGIDKMPDRSDFRAGFTELARALERGQQVNPRTPEQRREDLDSMEQNLTEDNELTKFENYWRFGAK